jgi:hydroxyethylthiazole kinase-like uncharacterized protein yjeF
MMKLFNTAQIREADNYTIKHEPVSSLNLMERAASAFVKQFSTDYPDKKNPVYIFCGNGNNGGDGLAIVRLLFKLKYKVQVFTFPSKKYSDDYLKNEKRLPQKLKKQQHQLTTINPIDTLSNKGIIIDAIFGTGLHDSIQKDSIHYKVIERINACCFHSVVAVDIPSGLLTDEHTDGIVLKTSKTYTFQFPKLSFLLPENGLYLNDFTILDIGLHPEYSRKTSSPFFLITKEAVHLKIPVRKKYAHKGNYGHAMIAAGSYGKMGAAILAGKACLRAGAGMLTMHLPSCGYSIVQAAFPEAMCVVDKQEKHISVVSSYEKTNAIAIGPGIGTHTATKKAIEQFLRNQTQPIVIDADALNILAAKKSLLPMLPVNSILTPHPKEFERLAGKWKNDFERLQLQQQFSKKHKVIVVLKGAHTSISDTTGNVYFNTTGNPGMATAGSGDVLTGIITGLLAQQLSPLDSAIAGVYLHGLAGDKALQLQSQESLIATDIIASLGTAFKEIQI